MPAGAHADEINDCERLGTEQLADSTFERPFEIDREKLSFDKAEAEVGSQFVSSVLHGPANMDTGGEMESVGFLCLHGGTDIGALFVVGAGRSGRRKAGCRERLANCPPSVDRRISGAAGRTHLMG